MDVVLGGVWQTFSGRIVELLPRSPLADIDFDVWADYLSVLNWVVPVGLIVDTLGVVLSCLSVYYGLRIILRLLHVVD